jgi:DNA-binding beta-propeller fold protein YncE
MLEVRMKPIAKSGVLTLMLLTLSWLAPVSLHADKKKKQVNTPAPAAQNVEIPDFTKIVFPPEPAAPRIRYLDYFSSSLPEELTQQEKKETKKAGWMDRLAGTDPNAGGGKQKKPHYQLLAPYGVAVDSKGLLYVADTKVGAIFIFNTENDDITLIRNGADARMKSIIGLAMDDSDHLFVTDNGSHSVLEFDKNHKYLGTFGGGELRNPCGIAIDQENRFLYVVDTDLDQVIVFDADSHKVLRKLGTTGKNHTLTSPGDFSKPTNVAVNADGDVFVSDTLNDRVEVFDADGNFIRAFGKNGDALGNFARPKGIAIDSDGHVWVADAMLNRLTVLTPEGQPLMAFGGYGIGPAQFQALTGLAFDGKSKRLFSAEQVYGRIQMFRYYTDAEAKAELEKHTDATAKKPEAASSGAAASPAAGADAAKDTQAQPAGDFSKIPSMNGQAGTKP